MRGNKGDKRIDVNLEQARFQTEKEINENFTRIEYGELSKKEIVGIPIKIQQEKEKLYVNFAPNAHTLIIGTTGSGKTTTFINPTVQVHVLPLNSSLISNRNTKPCEIKQLSTKPNR